VAQIVDGKREKTVNHVRWVEEYNFVRIKLYCKSYFKEWSPFRMSHYPDFVRLFHTSTHLRSVELGMRKEGRVISHFHTSEKCRTKGEKGK